MPSRMRPSGPTTPSATSGSTGCAACPPSAAGGPRTTRSSWPAMRRPGRRPSGLDQGLDPNVTLERIARTDARVIVCGHTHLPEIRDLGWKWIVNDGSAGYVFDGEPTASWALIDVEGDDVRARDPADRVRRAVGGQRHLGPWPGRRRLSRRHRPHRKARPMSRPSDRRDRDGPGHRPGQDVASTWAGLVAGRSGVDTITAFDPSRCHVAHGRRGQGLRLRATSSTARTSGGPIATSSSGWSPPARRWTRPGCPIASRASWPRRPGSSSAPGSAASGRSSRASRPTPCAVRTGSARSSSRWASPTPARARSPSTSG